mgnify:CR=1 FL=1
MKCKWCADFEGVCTNGECPYRGDTCPTSEYPEVCKYAEKQTEIPQLSVKELVKTLRLCGSTSCRGCALFEFADCGRTAKLQAADALEKLAAEKDEKKPEWISVKDRLLEKDDVVLARIDKGKDQTEIISRVLYYNDGVTFEGYSLDVPAQAAEGGKAMNTTEERTLKWLNDNIDFFARYRENPINANRTAAYDEWIERQRTAISAIETCRQLKKSLFGKENVTNDELVRMALQLKSRRCEDREGAETGGRTMKTPDEIKKAVSLCILSECSEACPYYGDVSCSTMLMLDIFACLEQLEAEREGKSDERNA